jgi:hypothetical protein
MRHVAIAVMAAAAAAALQSATVAGSARFEDPIYRDRNTVDDLAPEHIGPDYACAVVTRRTSSQPRKLLIQVVSGEAAIRAHWVRRSLDQPRRARVWVTESRYRSRTLARIRRRVLRSMPRDRSDSGVSFERTINRTTCPRVEIILERRGKATAAKERWASDARTRYGRDRVMIRRGTPEPRDGAR